MIRELKDETDGLIYVSGSGTLVRGLLEERLVDRLHLFVPVAVCKGKRLRGGDVGPTRSTCRPVILPPTVREKECVLDMRLELVPLPSTDVDRSKAFYADRVGFNVDHDVEPGNGMRIVQLTPPGSACSIVIGVGISDPNAAPVLNLHLVVDDVDAARRTLIGNGIDVSDVSDMGGGIRYAYFSDPDGNSWALQQLSG